MAAASSATHEEAGEKWGREVTSHLCLKGEVHTLHSHGQKERSLLLFRGLQLCLHPPLCGFFFFQECALTIYLYPLVLISCSPHLRWSWCFQFAPKMSYELRMATINLTMLSWCQTSQEHHLRFKYFSFKLWHSSVHPSNALPKRYGPAVHVFASSQEKSAFIPALAQMSCASSSMRTLKLEKGSSTILLLILNPAATGTKQCPANAPHIALCGTVADPVWPKKTIRFFPCSFQSFFCDVLWFAKA